MDILEKLRRCVDWAEEHDQDEEGVWFDSEAFYDMYERADEGVPLSDKQTRWIESVFARLFPDEAAPPDFSQIPRGKEVPVPEVLKNLPKRPPGK